MFFLYTTLTYPFPNVRLEQGTTLLVTGLDYLPRFSSVITTVNKRPKQELIVFSGTQ